MSSSSARFPIRRVFCVGRNYAAHAREMGKDPDREPPFFFMKPADAVVDAAGTIAYPSLTTAFHHEIELVVALGSGGRDVAPDDALNLVWGYGVAVGQTRRDLQDEAKRLSRPWDWSKGFDASAPYSPAMWCPAGWSASRNSRSRSAQQPIRRTLDLSPGDIDLTNGQRPQRMYRTDDATRRWASRNLDDTEQAVTYPVPDPDRFGK